MWNFLLFFTALQKHWPLLAVLIGSKRLLLGFLTMSLLSHLLQPLAVILSRDVTTWTFTLLRFFNDVATAGYFPACVALLNKWAPPQERLLMLCIEFSALYLSTCACLLPIGHVFSAYARWLFSLKFL